jgi:hypothetical protein
MDDIIDLELEKIDDILGKIMQILKVKKLKL